MYFCFPFTIKTNNISNILLTSKYWHSKQMLAQHAKGDASLFVKHIQV